MPLVAMTATSVPMQVALGMAEILPTRMFGSVASMQRLVDRQRAALLQARTQLMQLHPDSQVAVAIKEKHTAAAFEAYYRLPEVATALKVFTEQLELGPTDVSLLLLPIALELEELPEAHQGPATHGLKPEFAKRAFGGALRWLPRHAVDLALLHLCDATEVSFTVVHPAARSTELWRPTMTPLAWRRAVFPFSGQVGGGSTRAVRVAPPRVTKRGAGGGDTV